MEGGATDLSSFMIKVVADAVGLGGTGNPNGCHLSLRSWNTKLRI
jgi:hypothetical protein